MNAINHSSTQTKILWIAVALLGALSFGIVALHRGESVNAAWLVIAAVCVYLIAFRFYALFIAGLARHVLPGAPWYVALLFYALAGTLWIVPIGLSLPWMYRESQRNK